MIFLKNAFVKSAQTYTKQFLPWSARSINTYFYLHNERAI